MSYKIIVDLSHNESAEFPEFVLGEELYEVDYIEESEGPISFDQIELYDILFIGNIEHTKDQEGDKFAPKELKAIKRFVGEGGGLFMTTGAGGDKDIPMKDGSIRVLYKITGVKRYWNGIIKEGKPNFRVKKHNLLFTDLYTHPITKGVGEVILPNCTFFTTESSSGLVEDIMTTSGKTKFNYYSDESTERIGAVPVAVISEFYNGRAFTIGSSDFLMEDTEYGVDGGDNLKFLENIIKWLAFET
jgi:hypothetical protein